MLSPKCYSLLCRDTESIKRGLKGVHTRTEISHQVFEAALYEKKEHTVKQSRFQYDSKNAKIDTWYDSKKSDIQSVTKSGPKPVQQPVQKSNSRKNRQKIQANQKNDMPSKLEVSVPKRDEKSKTSVAPPQKQPKITNRKLNKNDQKMTKSKSDKKVAKNVETSNSTSKQTKIDITKIDQSLGRNKRTNKTSRREIFDETKNPEQTIRTLMYEE